MLQDDSLYASLIHDWNLAGDVFCPDQPVMVSDETLRDGLQSPSVRHPDITDKVYLLYLMNDLGVDIADLGLCCAGERFKNNVTVLAREIADQGMGVQPQSAARSMIGDIAPIVDASNDAGIAIEAAVFLGTSPLRQLVEGWDLDFMLRQTEKAVSFAVSQGLGVMFVTEDTIRSKPETLKAIYRAAIRAGAHRICAADTVGHITPSGTFALISFLREVVDEVDPSVGIDWHGHRDRGLDIANSLEAVRAGADRIHACGLGIGERSGNTPMELLLVNLNLLGWADRDLHRLPEYCQVIAEKCGVPVPFNYPVVGADSFRTSTGVHAAAIAKALESNEPLLADSVYCGVPAGMVGREQGVEIGPMSGEHNVRFFLRRRGIEENPVFVEKILAAAKRSNRLLAEDDVLRMVKVMQARIKAGGEIDSLDLAPQIQGS